MPAALRTVYAIVSLLVMTSTSQALMPLLRPEPAPDIATGQSAPFAGRWSVTLPTMEAGSPDADYAVCKLPVRIEATGESHIAYQGPRDRYPDATLALSKRGIGTHWKEVGTDNGPTYFTVWIDANLFYLYDFIPETEAEWGRPFLYRRCP